MRKQALSRLKNYLLNEIILIKYTLSNGTDVCEKFFIKDLGNFCNEETGQINVISYAEDKKITLNISEIVNYTLIHPDNEISTTEIADKIKADYQKFKPLSVHFNNFDTAFFNPETNLQKLKICCYLELNSLDEFEDNSENTLTKLKQFWKKQIELHKQQTLEYINKELVTSENESFSEESINEIKELIFNYDSTSDLDQISSKQDLFEFWPTILLPAPDFINELFVDVFGLSSETE